MLVHAFPLDGIHQFADAFVHDFDHGCIRCHVVCPLLLLFGRQVFPGRTLAAKFLVEYRQFHLFGHQSQLLLLLEALTAEHVIPHLVPVQAFFHRFLRSLQRQMRSIVGHVEEHGTAGIVPVYKADGRVGNGPCIIIVVGDGMDAFQVVVQRFRLVIAAAAMQAAIIAVEAPLHGIAAVGRFITAGSGHMPFPAHIGAVSVFSHDFGNGRISLVYLPAIPRTMLVHLGHPSHAHLVLVSSGQQGSPAGATASCILELAEADTFRGQFVQVGGLYFAAIAADVRESHVVAHNQYNVGSGRVLGHCRKQSARKQGGV